MGFILSYRKPRSTFNRVLNERRRSFSSTIHLHDKRTTQLLGWTALPEWHRDNRFITSGYRPESFSVWTCFQSIFHLHNETVNIWTHLLPALVLSISQVLLQHLITQTYPHATLLDRLVFATNLLTATLCLLFSASYHTLMCHSHPVSALWLRLDYIGILTLILGSFFSGIYVGFYCDPTPRNTYWSMIILLSLATSILVLHPRLQGLKHRTLRTLAFILTGLSGFAPIIHGLYQYGWAQMWIRSGMPYYFLEGLIYGVGASFFATRFPECVWPGTFDIFGSSHQIFHVLVLLASAVHGVGVWRAYGWSYEFQRTCGVVEGI